ncbi:hypothetical protein VSR01_16615 [Actinacidiphila sp. DG2A-62]|uniref:hypothetical protein n=1 Tax=Actinacidiphila sp. DG2A-62 TaxID=3108821 RepID=UPI002DBFEBB0|nr:hypothetical protein [Actinacidiphila sp. DG2A-62]MEC3995070.1 hypothetical protein [Actinacidiphila sp. DG2A-62]
MNLQELALEEAALKAIEEMVKARLKLVTERRAEVNKQLRAELQKTGVGRVDAMMGGRKVAVISRSEPSKPAAVVTDEARFSKWAAKHVPHNTVTTVTVRPAYTKALLGQLTEAGSTRAIVGDRTRPITVAGVELRSARGGSHSVRSLDAAAVAEGWHAGELAHLEGLRSLAGIADLLEVPVGGIA